MNSFFYKIKTVFLDRSLRHRILFILAIFALFRLLSTIPIPGVDATALESFLSGNQFFGLLNIFSGGALAQLSIVMLGVGPFITASIIMQLLTVMSPKIKDMYHHSGELGRKKFNQISRYLTIPIAAIQGFGLLTLLAQQGVITQLGTVGFIVNILIVVTGAFFVTWLGELISEFGMGNGVSLIIFAGIVAAVPGQIAQLIFTYSPDKLFVYLLGLVTTVLIVAGIVAITEAERPLPVTYAKQSRGGSVYGGTASYIPLRINMAGVMPIIFGISILLFPQMLGNIFAASSKVGLQNIGQFITTVMNNGAIYAIIYFVLVFAFTYFYTAITFDPETMASNLQKNGAFVPGVRPGKTTQDYIGTIVSRITLVGALFLSIIAVIPIIMTAVTGSASLGIGGTSLLIVVAVIIDLIKKIDAQVAMRQY